VIAALVIVRNAMPNPKKPGLWNNIRKKRASGRRMSPKGSKAYKKAVAAGKKLKAAAKRKKRKTTKKR